MRYMSPWIFTTRDCNLRCEYCYEKHEKIKMEKVVYEKINDTFEKLLENDLDFVVYRLSGGEPLLEFNNWKNHMIDFMSTKRDKKFISLITNLTILTDEMIELFKSLNFGFGVSLDSVSFSKPYINGKSSAKEVMKNIDKLISVGIKDNLDISTVIDRNSFKDIECLAQWVSERDLNWGIYLDHFFCGEISVDEIINKMKLVIDTLNKNGYDIYNKLKFNNIKIKNTYEGCTAGEKLLAINTDGNVFPCQTSIYEKEICNIFTTNDLIKELKSQESYKIGYNYKLPKDCSECAISEICGGGCKLHNKEINKNYTCDIMKSVILYMLYKIVEKEEK